MPNANPWLSRRVVSFAHQGGAAEGPSSTIEAMQLARQHGTAALEFDLHLTRDPDLVLHHDPTLVVDGQRVKIADHDVAELRRMKPNIVTLDEVLAAFPGVPLTVEVKARKAAELAAHKLAAELGDRLVVVTAFNPLTVATVKRVAPDLDTAPGWPTILVFWLLSRVRLPAPVGRKHVALQVSLRLDQVKGVKAIPLVRRLRVADKRLVRAAHRRGLAVHVWTLNDEPEMAAALQSGADGIFTDRPSVLTRVLDAEGVRWEGP